MITIKYPLAEFEYDHFYGELIFELQPTDGNEYDLVINHVVAFNHGIEIELEYILTDAEHMQLLSDLYDEVADIDLYEELKQEEQDYHDDLNYECWKHEQ